MHGIRALIPQERDTGSQERRGEGISSRPLWHDACIGWHGVYRSRRKVTQQSPKTPRPQAAGATCGRGNGHALVRAYRAMTICRAAVPALLRSTTVYVPEGRCPTETGTAVVPAGSVASSSRVPTSRPSAS
jgi:hypothetical protein